MDRFPDGAHVWLRSRERDAYLIADDDASGVSLSASRARLDAAWRVQRVLHDGTPCVLLQSAAYGSYLALSRYTAPHGHRGRLAILRDFQEPRQRNIRWRAITAGDGGGDVLLCTMEEQERYLRAHVGHRKQEPCSCITIDGLRTTMMHWTVEQIPPRPAPPALPAPSTEERDSDWQRKIIYRRRNFLGTEAVGFKFSGRSVFNLRRDVAMKMNKDMSTITLCVHAGFYGRLTPLVIDLPRSKESLDIIVLPTSSAAARALLHPDIDLPPPPPPPQGTELLTDGAFVRLKCRVGGQNCYLHAKEDGTGVNLSPQATSVREVWAVHQIEIDGDDFVLFRGAAYGRYFALMPEGKTSASRFAQVNYDHPEQSNLLWVASPLKGSKEVNLRSGNGATCLDVHWTIEVVPMSPSPPLLPASAAAKGPKTDTDPEPPERMAKGPKTGTDPEPPERMVWFRWEDVWYRRKDDKKMANNWTTVLFKGQSLCALRSKLSNDSSLILCTRAGRCGQLTPLITDLPNNNETMEVIILTPGSPVAQELRYPVVNPRGV